MSLVVGLLLVFIFALLVGVGIYIYIYGIPNFNNTTTSSQAQTTSGQIRTTSSQAQTTSSQAQTTSSSSTTSGQSQTTSSSSTTSGQSQTTSSSSTMGKDIVLTGKDNLKNTINDILTEGDQCDTDTFCQTGFGPAAKCSKWSSLSSTVQASLTKPGAVGAASLADVFGTYQTKDIKFCYIDPTLAITVSSNKDNCITKYGSAVSDYMEPPVTANKAGCSADPKCKVNEYAMLGWFCDGGVSEPMSSDECTKKEDCDTYETCDIYKNISDADRISNNLKTDANLYGNYKMCYLKSGDNTVLANAFDKTCTDNFMKNMDLMKNDPTADKKAICEYKVGTAPTFCQYKDQKCVGK